MIKLHWSCIFWWLEIRCSIHCGEYRFMRVCGHQYPVGNTINSIRILRYEALIAIIFIIKFNLNKFAGALLVQLTLNAKQEYTVFTLWTIGKAKIQNKQRKKTITKLHGLYAKSRQESIDGNLRLLNKIQLIHKLPKISERERLFTSLMWHW